MAQGVEWAFKIPIRNIPGYAYNVPRDRLDAVLRRICQEAGAQLIPDRARVERGADGEAVLAGESLPAATKVLGGPPDAGLYDGFSRHERQQDSGHCKRSDERGHDGAFDHAPWIVRPGLAL